jgi:hypothetical protein
MERNEIIRRAKWPFIFLLVVAGAAGVILYYFLFIKVEPGPLLESALNKAHQAKSYRYTLDSLCVFYHLARHDISLLHIPSCSISRRDYRLLF